LIRRHGLTAGSLALLSLVLVCVVGGAAPVSPGPGRQAPAGAPSTVAPASVASPRRAAGAPAACADGSSAAPVPDPVIEDMPRGVKDPARPCPPASLPPSITSSPEKVLLAIAPRGHAPEHPPEGWCGEAAVQMALLYHGAYVPQKQINAAGRPQHPDLYSHEIPAALQNLGVEFRMPRAESRNFPAFLAWMKRQIGQMVPVLIGVKIYPTQHPEWGLDHFMLAVGATKDSLIYNTTWDKQEARSESLLFSTEPGFSFRNSQNAYYGIAIAGIGRRTDAHATVRLFVTGEQDGLVGVIVKCEDLQPRARYVAYKVSRLDQKTAKPLAVFVATESAYGFYDAIPAGEAAIYRCRKAPVTQEPAKSAAERHVTTAGQAGHAA
jgi:hypothetical protein